MNCQLEHIRVLACLTALAAASAALAGDAIRRSDETRQALEYRFTPADEALLNEVQHACFLYFWKEVGQPARLVKDRKLAPVSSVAAVGFQLSSLPIGVERGWITRPEGDERARPVLKALIERDDNKKFGVYLQYPDMNTGRLSKAGFEILDSNGDHALSTAGAMPAAGSAWRDPAAAPSPACSSTRRRGGRTGRRLARRSAGARGG